MEHINVVWIMRTDYDNVPNFVCTFCILSSSTLLFPLPNIIQKMEPWDKPSGNSIERIQKVHSAGDVEDSGTVN